MVCLWDDPEGVFSRWHHELRDDVYLAVVDWMVWLCDDPGEFPPVEVEGEPTPRRYAPIDGTDAVLAYAVTERPDGRCVVVVLAVLEPGPGLWIPSDLNEL